jgi:hypothetical protein
MKRIAAGLAGLIATVVVLSPPVGAVDSPKSGKKLLIKNASSGNKVVLISKDGTIFASTDYPAYNPTTSSGNNIRIQGAGGDVTIPLPAQNWEVSQESFKYEDANCKLTAKHLEKLKLKCKGPVVAYTLGVAETAVNVTVSYGSAPMTLCFTFGGDIKKDGSDGKKFLAKDAPNGTCASSGQPCDGGGGETDYFTCTNSPACPAGEVCSVDLYPFGQCFCVAGSVPCNDTTYPSCGGACPAGQVCIPIGYDRVPGTSISGCGCSPQGINCEGGLPSACSYGPCPSGMKCSATVVCAGIPEECGCTAAGCVPQ